MAVMFHINDSTAYLLARKRRKAQVAQLIIDRNFLASLNFTPAQVQVYQDRIADIQTRFSRLRAGSQKQTPYWGIGTESRGP